MRNILPKFTFNQEIEIVRETAPGFHAAWPVGAKGIVTSITNTGRMGEWFYRIGYDKDENGYELSAVEGILKRGERSRIRYHREWMQQAWLLYGVTIELMEERLRYFSQWIDDARPSSRTYMKPGTVEFISAPTSTNDSFVIRDGERHFALHPEAVEVTSGPGIMRGQRSSVGLLIRTIDMLE